MNVSQDAISSTTPSRVGEGGEGELVPLLRLRLADVLLVIIDVVRGRGDAGRQGYLCGRGRAGSASVWENRARGARSDREYVTAARLTIEGEGIRAPFVVDNVQERSGDRHGSVRAAHLAPWSDEE